MERAARVDWWEALRNFQTLISASIGFTGVIITLFINAALTRKQERAKELRDARALRTSLIEELRVQRGAIERASKSLKKSADDSPNSGGILPVFRFTEIFDRSIDRLGILERSEVAAVLQAYVPLRGLTWRLRLLEAISNSTSLSNTHPDHIGLNAESYETARRMHERHLPAIDAALSELQSRL